MCENERIESHRGRALGTPPRSANEMDAQMSKILVICMLLSTGLTRIQDGGEFPIGSHYNVVAFQTRIGSSLSACNLFSSQIFINYKSENTLQQSF